MSVVAFLKGILLPRNKKAKNKPKNTVHHKVQGTGLRLSLQQTTCKSNGRRPDLRKRKRK
jgi:hypothetical protein